jgi:hypothetical protein
MILDSFDDGTTKRNCVAWYHWNVCSGGFRCGAWTPVLRSYTVFTVGSRRRHHHVLCFLCRREWLLCSLLPNFCANVDFTHQMKKVETSPRQCRWQCCNTEVWGPAYSEESDILILLSVALSKNTPALVHSTTVIMSTFYVVVGSHPCMV